MIKSNPTISYRKDYPRPGLVRSSWLNLDGSWAFLTDDSKLGESLGWQKHFPDAFQTIQVPFSYETAASGVHDETAHSCVWYQRPLILPENWESEKKRILLHFEGCDYETTVWVNGQKAGTHIGGYTRFSFDITELLKENFSKENILTVRAEDSFDMQQMRGKQRWRNENFACWYVQTTGIWKTVWVEAVPAIYLSYLKLTPHVKEHALSMELEVQGGLSESSSLSAMAEISFHGTPIQTASVSFKNTGRTCRSSITADVFHIGESSELSGVHLWSPEKPDLYDLKISLFKDGHLCDEIYSYFGMREIESRNGQILLNGEPLYQKLILDQGYWKETGLTPPSEEALITDILKTKELGFNGARKHQKTEDDRWYYWCDVLGLAVWCEAPAAYVFSDCAISETVQTWTDIVCQHYNHPSILVWTPFNESWGVPQIAADRRQQQFTEAVYHLIHSLDSTRLVISNDGWEHTVSDILTLHDYEEDAARFLERYLDRKEEILSGRLCHNLSRAAFADGFSYQGQPVILSEFGGIAFQNGQEGWGYGNKVKTEADFLERFRSITMAVKQLSYVCGYCYTQLTDVQQEINGLMDENRVHKVDPAKIRAVNEELPSPGRLR